MTLYIKNMVCNRCILVVKQELEKLNLPYTHVQLGEVGLEKDLTEKQLEKLNAQLQPLGFAIIDDRKKRIVEKIKNIITKMVHQNKEMPKSTISDYLAGQLHYDYNYLSSLFSDIESTTIEKYIINQKIERVKELLVYDEFTLNEIAYQMGYSSVAHLS